MEKYLRQPVGSTALDLQGEALGRSDLEAFTKISNGRRLPLHRQHNMSLPPMGYLENFALVEDPEQVDQWLLVADVYVERGTLDDALKGFSLSFTRPLVRRTSPDYLLYLSFPHYQDDPFISELRVDDKLSIGKWIKKGADPLSTATIVAGLYFLLAPAWDEFYKAKISPKLHKFMDSHWGTLQKKGIGLEHVQLVHFREQEIELRFIPAPGKEKFCFAESLLIGGIEAAESYLQRNEQVTEQSVVRIVLLYEPVLRQYEILRVELDDRSASFGTESSD